jgi:cell wall-associated NlpC family hydrolase
MISVLYEKRRLVPAAAVLLGAALTAGCASHTGVVRPSPFPGGGSADRAANAVVVPAGLVPRALALRGIPYRLGGEDPRFGLDCSGLVRFVFRAEGIAVPRTVAEQYRVGVTIRETDVRAGDLVFFDTARPGPSHVGIAIDSESFVHAPGQGGVVRVDRLASRYWRDRFKGVRRVGLAVP